MAFPSPTSVLLNTLVWLGVPLLVLTPLTIALAVAEWLKAVRAGARVTNSIGLQVESFWERTSWLRVVSLIVVQAVVVAATFSLLRFYVVLFAGDSPLHGGPQFQWKELWVALTTYSDSSGLPAKASLIALGWVIAINVAALTRLEGGHTLLMFVGLAIIAVAGLGALGWGVLFLMVWSLATWMHDPNYNLDMLSVYGVATGLSALLAVAVHQTMNLSTTVFSREAT